MVVRGFCRVIRGIRGLVGGVDGRLSEVFYLDCLGRIYEVVEVVGQGSLRGRSAGMENGWLDEGRGKWYRARGSFYGHFFAIADRPMSGTGAPG